MRFAWLKETKYSNSTFYSTLKDKTISIPYNLIWWLPVILPFTKVISYHTGFISFFFVTIARALLNAYRINILPPEKGIMFPFRSP